MAVFYPCHCTTMVVKLDHKIATVSHLDFSRVNTVQCEPKWSDRSSLERWRRTPSKEKKTLETNIFKFFLERESIYSFCCAANQNNPRKYVSYDRSHLLQPCGKFLLWASPIPLRNFSPLASPPPRSFHEPSVGVWIFSGTPQCLFFSPFFFGYLTGLVIWINLENFI